MLEIVSFEWVNNFSCLDFLTSEISFHFRIFCRQTLCDRTTCSSWYFPQGERYLSSCGKYFEEQHWFVLVVRSMSVFRRGWTTFWISRLFYGKHNTSQEELCLCIDLIEPRLVSLAYLCTWKPLFITIEPGGSTGNVFSAHQLNQTTIRQNYFLRRFVSYKIPTKLFMVSF